MYALRQKLNSNETPLYKSSSVSFECFYIEQDEKSALRFLDLTFNNIEANGADVLYQTLQVDFSL